MSLLEAFKKEIMADLVTITIDGQKVSVPKGTLVIEAATQIGVDVPRFAIIRNSPPLECAACVWVKSECRR
jgi:predicted molibdopterin-dependent oxidoreductase YjgC